MSAIITGGTPTPVAQFFENGQAIQKEAVVDLLLARMLNVDAVIKHMQKAEAMALAGMDWHVCNTVVGPITCRMLRPSDLHKDGAPKSDPTEPPPMIARRHADIPLWQKTTAEVNAEREIAARGGIKGSESQE